LIPTVRGRRSPAGARILAALLAAALLPAALARSQSRDWWDLYADALKIIENGSASDGQLESARRSLLSAIQERDTEGNLPTYNPSARLDYLPYFHLGWASLRLKRYDDAAKYFKKSGEIGFIAKGAPGELKKRFDSFQQLIQQLKPAADAVAAAKSNTFASQCLASADSASGPKIKDALAKLDAMLSSPTEAGALKGLVDSLNGSVGDCVKEIGGRRMAAAVKDYHAALDDVPTEGLADIIGADTQKELDSVLAAGKDAEAKGEESALKSATSRLKALPARIARDLDSRVGPLAQEAEKLARGNERALNEQNQLGARLADAASKAKGLRASGKSGGDLIAVAKSIGDLKSLVGTARGALAPLLQAKGNSLDAARKELESWSGAHACEVNAVGARAPADAALKEAAAARQGESVDALDAAIAKLTAIRPDVESRMKDVLPRKQEEAKGIVGNADGVLANISDPAKKTRGEGLKQDVQNGLAKGDICSLDSAIAALNGWVKTVAPELDRQRAVAVARNRPFLDDGQKLLSGFGGILKPGTVTALKAPVDRLAGLINSSYDTAAIDRAGQEVKALADAANGEVQGQMQEGIRSLRTLRSDVAWADVTASRRQWLEQNLPAVEKAVPEMSNPDLLSRFAKEYPRARLEMALASAFGALYDRGSAADAARTLEDLGPGLRAGSAALNFALSYFYWWQGQAASSTDREALMAKAREAFDAGKALRVDVAALGAPLFAPAFVEEMSRR